MTEELKEFWKDIPGYEGLYQISNLGNVKSFHKSKEKLLKLTTRRYVYVGLRKNDKTKTYFVHRLVYQAFKGDIPEGYEVNHIDENKYNNCIDNLNLLTHKENINYGTRNKRSAVSRSKKVLCVETGEIFIAVREVERKYGFAHNIISRCCLGKSKTAYGYHWLHI